LKKIFCFSEMQINRMTCHPDPKRELASVINAGRGTVEADAAIDDRR
jgi:hypothetical protein